MVEQSNGRADFATLHAIINDAAVAYRGVIPSDRWREPYMSEGELREQIGAGVRFYVYREAGETLGVMGIQPVRDVTLIRHAYVRTTARRKGIGASLLRHLTAMTTGPILIGTWRAATWAVDFYEKNGFRLVSEAEKDRLLRTYWQIPERQVATSVVLTNGLHSSP